MADYKNNFLDGAILFGPFRLAAGERILYRQDMPIQLSSRSFDILVALVERAGEVVSRRELISRAWPDMVVEEANLRISIASLRKALGDGVDGCHYVKNVPGRGYCFVSPVKFRSSPHEGHDEREDRDETLSAFCALPPAVPKVIGRDEAVRALVALIRSNRFVSVVGPGGMGKTTVAISVAHAMRAQFQDEVFFVDLGAISDSSIVPAAVAAALNLSPQSQNIIEILISFIAKRKLLLVIDNCEHVVDAVARLAETIFKEAPSVFMLTTTRESLRAAGECIYLLKPLEFQEKSEEATVEAALSCSAVQLFIDRALASGYRDVVDDSDAVLISEICRRLDGIPLAIELVAGRVGAYGIRGTADLLNHRFKLLWQGKRTALPRHQTLHAMLEWSYSLLSDIEQVVLCRLSIFSGNFTLEAAQSIAACAKINLLMLIDALRSLIDKSLVSCITGDGKAYHRLLEVTRSFAAAKLSESQEQHLVAKRHALYCLHVLASEKNDLIRVGRQDLSRYSSFIGDIQASLDWSFSDEGCGDTGVQIAAFATSIFLGMSLLRECQRWCETALNDMSEAHKGTEVELVLQEALAISMMYTHGNSYQVRYAIERGLVLAEKIGDASRRLNLLLGLHIFVTRRGSFHEALSIAQQGEQIAERVNTPASGVLSDWMLACSYHAIGEQEVARSYSESGFKRATETGLHNIDIFGYDHRIRALIVFARVLWLRGYPDQAVRVAREALEDAQSPDRPVNLCVARIYATTVLMWCGSLLEADKQIEQVIACAKKYSLDPYHAVGQAMKGELAVMRGQYSFGVTLLKESLSVLHAEMHHVLTTGFSRSLAEGLCESGRFDEALLTIDGALLRANAQQMTFDMPELWRIRGNILAKTNQYDDAEESLLKSLSYTQTQNALSLELRTAISLARLWGSNGHQFIATSVLNKAYQRFNEGYATLDLRIAKGMLDQFAGPSFDLRPERQNA
jgi:predicted ATPase/DNA-binding winged helix-turn-helix (wHTH) protein